MSTLDPFEKGESLPFETDVHTTNSLLNSGDPPVLLDIREPIEVQVCQIRNSIHIPMGEIPMLWRSIPKDRRVIVYCHHGRRSLMVTQFLRQHGIGLAQSMLGGIEAWSLEIDPSVRRY